MAQYGRPDGDVTTTGVAGGNYASIDEITPSDADFIYGAEATAVTYECSLTNITDPVSDTGISFTYRVAKLNGTTTDGAGNAVYVTTYLYEGATLRASDTQKTLTDTWTDYTYNCTTAECDALSDFTDLRLRFVSPSSAGNATTRRAMGLSYAVLTAPTAPVAPLDATTQTYTFTGIAATLTVARKVDITAAEFILTGIDATLAKTIVLPITKTEFTFTGIAAGFTVARKIDITKAEFTLTGVDSVLAKTVIMPATVAEFTLTGTATGLLAARTLGITVGEFVLTGIDTGLTKSIIMPAVKAEYSLTGIDAGLLATRKFDATKAEYTYSGIDTGLLASRLLAGATQTYSLTGIDVGLLAAYTFTADNTTYAVTGIDVELTYNESVGAYTLDVSCGEFEMTSRRCDINFKYRKGWNRFKPVTPAKIHKHKARTDVVRFDDGSWEGR
ncbi:MAG: hypothetical protein UW18_C0011G0010 [Microgenomates group bacterium GW2011_GWF1_44_10]|nr:MAG: hypothetical protein UW18_C0011G0010 [Microgenomates group bacterium GW2011_GWF1_44_10]